jgi:hypothetical protein
VILYVLTEGDYEDEQPIGIYSDLDVAKAQREGREWESLVWGEDDGVRAPVGSLYSPGLDLDHPDLTIYPLELDSTPLDFRGPLDE